MTPFGGAFLQHQFATNHYSSQIFLIESKKRLFSPGGSVGPPDVSAVLPGGGRGRGSAGGVGAADGAGGAVRVLRGGGGGGGRVVGGVRGGRAGLGRRVCWGKGSVY